MSPPRSAQPRVQRTLRAWVALGLLAFVLLPWYLPQDLGLWQALGGVFGGPDAASGMTLLWRHQRAAPALALAGLVLAGVAALRPAGARLGWWLLAGAGLGGAAHLGAGFLVAQPGFGLGAALLLLDVRVQDSYAVAPEGHFQGDMVWLAAGAECIRAAVLGAGYRRVALDLRGYRSGSLNVLSGVVAG